MRRAALPALVRVAVAATMMTSLSRSLAFAGETRGEIVVDATLIASGQIADYVSSVSALSRCPGCVEANPLLRNSAQAAAVKVAVSAGIVYACHKLRKKGKKREARVVALVFGAVGAGMAIHNMRRGR